ARGGVRLACAVYGGEGSPVALLHGVAGNAREWDDTASWLVESHRVFAVDARGHGQSERRPGDVSRAARSAKSCMAFGVTAVRRRCPSSGSAVLVRACR